MKTVNTYFLLSVFLLLAPVIVNASSCDENNIVNGGFENPIVPFGGTITKDDGLADAPEFLWSTNAAWYLMTDDYMLMTEGGAGAAPPEGYQAFYFYGGKVYQNTGLTVQENTRYILKFRLMVSSLSYPNHYFFAAFENPSGEFFHYSGSYLPLFMSTYQWSQEINFVFDSAQNPSALGQPLVASLYSNAFSYIDDVKLFVSPSGDFDSNCIVNMRDLALMADNWLVNTIQ
ncbi:MAG: hypothetical protein A2Y10_11325 [Planctomycetes bacterium GWF2_41_51]|nr:MAG: hypothetical protein A2Y10_11325 [Planctomycetes bacterium GWF2_41_51]HBG26887.1 hypothetical protein [Phycisphaerales bacterium]